MYRDVSSTLATSTNFIMKEENIKFIQQTLQSIYDVRDDARKSLLNDGFQLLIAQMDFLKTLATLVIGGSAIGYIYAQLDK